MLCAHSHWSIHKSLSKNSLSLIFQSHSFQTLINQRSHLPCTSQPQATFPSTQSKWTTLLLETLPGDRISIFYWSCKSSLSATKYRGSPLLASTNVIVSFMYTSAQIVFLLFQLVIGTPCEDICRWHGNMSLLAQDSYLGSLDLPRSNPDFTIPIVWYVTALFTQHYDIVDLLILDHDE